MFKYPLSLENHWLHHAIWPLTELQQQWLFGTGSLTAKLKANTNQFSVEVLSEKHMMLTESDALMCGLAVQNVLVREVLLMGNGQAQVYAQSWIPTDLLDNDLSLAALGDKPLGEYLFQHADLIRNTIEVAQFSVSHCLLQLVKSLNLPAACCYGRRSVFSLAEHKIMVCEIFLPNSVLYR